jgi:O-methyltransferase
MKSDYIELLKKTLTYSLWPEPPVCLSTYQDCDPETRSLLDRMAATSGTPANHLCLAEAKPVSEQAREEGTFWPSVADTMVGLRRLDNVEYCVRRVLGEGVPGDFIECGVWRGGVGILMRALLREHHEATRTVWLADSFRGLPPPEPDRFPLDANDTHHTFSELAIPLEEVQRRFARYGLLDEQVKFLEGWFRDSLPAAPIATVSVLRLDGDMYGSTMDALDALYHKLSPGGFCIVDDYSLPACRQAVLDFRAAHGVAERIEPVDWTGVFWRKA